MFVGHYGVSFAAARRSVFVPLWVLFIAVQLLDFGWAVLVLFGVEKARIVPGITASNPLDLYYMPYRAAAVTALAAYVVFAVVIRLLEGRREIGATFGCGGRVATGSREI
jgi:hypothetical protein